MAKLLTSSSQHGFVQKNSTITNLAVFSQYISKVIDGNGQCEVIYTDLEQAYDKIDPCLSLQKLCHRKMKIGVRSSYLVPHLRNPSQGPTPEIEKIGTMHLFLTNKEERLEKVLKAML